MKLTEFEEVKYPSRRPWLLLGALAIIVAVLLVRYVSGRSRPAAEAPIVISQTEGAPSQAEPAAKALTPGAEPSGASPQVAERLEKARLLEEQGGLAEARRILQDVLRASLSTEERYAVETRLGRINPALVLSPEPASS